MRELLTLCAKPLALQGPNARPWHVPEQEHLLLQNGRPEAAVHPALPCPSDLPTQLEHDAREARRLERQGKEAQSLSTDPPIHEGVRIVHEALSLWASRLELRSHLHIKEDLQTRQHCAGRARADV